LHLPAWVLDETLEKSLRGTMESDGTWKLSHEKTGEWIEGMLTVVQAPARPPVGDDVRSLILPPGSLFHRPPSQSGIQSLVTSTPTVRNVGDEVTRLTIKTNRDSLRRRLQRRTKVSSRLLLRRKGLSPLHPRLHA
jgi:hypothetical protein